MEEPEDVRLGVGRVINSASMRLVEGTAPSGKSRHGQVCARSSGLDVHFSTIKSLRSSMVGHDEINGDGTPIFDSSRETGIRLPLPNP